MEQKKFRVRCTEMVGGYISPDLTEIYNLSNPEEVYPLGRNQFRIGQVVTEEEIYFMDYKYGDEVWPIAMRK